MKIGIISPSNPSKGLFRDAECLVWALEKGSKDEVEVFYADNLRKIERTELSSNHQGSPPKNNHITFEKWVNGLDVVVMLEVINPIVLNLENERTRVVYIPNLEWAIIDSANPDVDEWIAYLKSLQDRITVIAKTKKISGVLTKNKISNSLIEWSIPDKIITPRFSISRMLRNLFSKKKTVLMNAGMGGWKSRRGVDIMIQAIRKISQNCDYHFILKTIKPWEDYELGEKPEKLELIDGFLDRSEMNSLVESVDIVVYPSRFEGFGLSLLETLHRGTPVMCTNGWPMNELQTIDDERLKIRSTKESSLRLATSYEPSSNSIVSNLEHLSNKNLNRIFSQKKVIAGLKERQELFVLQICSLFGE